MSRTRVSWACAVWLAVVPVAGAQPVERDVYVSVTDRAGLPITDLGASFFAIREDGRDREVIRATPVSGPVHLALLADTSGAVGQAIQPYREALAAFVGMMPPGSVVALYEFGGNPLPVVPFTSDLDAVRAGISRLSGRVDTMPRLIDAVEMACRDLKTRAATRPVVVAVSVGGTDTSARTAGKVIKLLVDIPAAFLAVAVGSASGGPSTPSLTSASGRDVVARHERLVQLEAEGEGHREQTRLLTEGPAKTGGVVHRVSSLLAVGPALDRVAAELNATYRVTFARQGGGKPRDLQVGVLLEDVTVRATAAPGRN